MDQTKSQACPECGSRMVFERRSDVVTYLAHERTVRISGWWCDACGEAILDGAALRLRERAHATLKAKVEDVLAPREVAAVRRKLGLSQRRAGELLGGGPRAFQKYESGEQSVSVPMTRLLTLLANEPARLLELVSETKRDTLVARDSSTKRNSVGRSRSK
jgi:HTH-type transcriptional regulator/antitoxin MqsA